MNNGEFMDSSANPQNRPVAVIGLGLMGRSIVACLLAAGHPVLGVTRNAGKRRDSRAEIRELLGQMESEGLLKENPEQALNRFEITDDYRDLSSCTVVIESIIENWDVKKKTLRRVEEHVGPDAMVASNTSAIPVTLLQKDALHPERILGMHWAEPAHVTRFMEIICGERTDAAVAGAAIELARGWGKEPTLVKRDIRGFIANRVMYAMIREAFFLVENGYATPADVDRSVRNDVGWWITFAGPFRFMDLTGIQAYASVMKDLFPELDCSKEVPPLMQKTAASGAQGVSNAQGFYPYSEESAKRWHELFLKFSYEIRALAQRYPENAGD
jgi:3-hydroxybutyryl-CoA dehydrogenase